MARYTLVTLGRCAVEAADGSTVDLPAGKPFAILVYLATERRPVRRDELAGLFWPDSPRQRAMQSVRQALWLLRQRLSEDCVRGGDAIAVNAEVVETDAWRMMMLVAEGRVDEGALLWGGSWLGGLDLPDCRAWQGWADRQRLRIDTVLADALHSAATDGPADRALARLEQAVRIEPENPRHAIALAEVLLDRQEPEAASRLLAELRHQDTVSVHGEAVSALERRARQMVRTRVSEAGAFPKRPPFVDRVGELAEMARLWRRTKEGATSRVVVRGPTGIGRSRLCEELALMVRSDGCRVVRVVVAESDAGLELGVVASLARELLGLSGARGVTVASDAVLRSLLPSLSAAPPEAGPHPTAYADALMDLVSAVAYEGPLLIVFEDTQWLDGASRAVVSRLARQIDREPVMLVATVSTDHPNAATERTLDELRRHTAVEVITLRGLDRAATIEWVAATLDCASAEALAGFAQRLHAATKGNPGQAVACLAALAEGGAIRPIGARWRLLPERLPHVLPVPAPDRRGHQPGVRRAILTIVAMLLIAALTLLVVQGAMRDPAPPWGGGELWWIRGDTAMVLIPVDRGAQWLVQASPIEIPAGATIAGPSITVTGERFNYLQRTSPYRTPWVTRLLADGTEVVVAEGETDTNFGSLSPDGRRLLYTRDDPATEAYDLGIVLSEPDGSSPRTIFQLPGKMNPGSWSSDGSAILLSTIGRPDSILVISPDGERLHSLARDFVTRVGWCGPGQVFFRSGWKPEEPLHVWDFATGEVRQLDFFPLPTAVVCSPDGSAIAGYVADGSRTKLVVHDIPSGETLPVLDRPIAVGHLVWTARPGPLIDRVEIVASDTVLLWGARDTLRAQVFDSNGQARGDSVTWRSTNPHVASIDARGELSANAPGEASIIATAGVWRSDTLRVRVTGDSDVTVLFADPLTSIDTTFWKAHGEPVPVIVQHPEGPVLSLPGDGVYRDGLVSRRGLDLTRGATLEVSLRLRLNRLDRQQFSVYLFKRRPGDDEPPDPDRADSPIAVTWPADELVRFDVDNLAVNVGAMLFMDPLPESFASDDWNRMTLQVRADGQVSAWVNGDLVSTPSLPIDLTDNRPWHIAILGAALDTELLARDLIVWEGPRYIAHGQ